MSTLDSTFSWLYNTTIIPLSSSSSPLITVQGTRYACAFCLCLRCISLHAGTALSFLTSNPPHTSSFSVVFPSFSRKIQHNSKTSSTTDPPLPLPHENAIINPHIKLLLISSVTEARRSTSLGNQQLPISACDFYCNGRDHRQVAPSQSAFVATSSNSHSSTPPFLSDLLFANCSFQLEDLSPFFTFDWSYRVCDNYTNFGAPRRTGLAVKRSNCSAQGTTVTHCENFFIVYYYKNIPG